MLSGSSVMLSGGRIYRRFGTAAWILKVDYTVPEKAVKKYGVRVNLFFRAAYAFILKMEAIYPSEMLILKAPLSRTRNKVQCVAGRIADSMDSCTLLTCTRTNCLI